MGGTHRPSHKTVLGTTGVGGVSFRPRKDQLAALLAATQALASSLDLETTLRTVVEQAATLAQAPIVRLFLVDEATQTLHCRVAAGVPEAQAARYIIPVGKSLSGGVAASGRPLAVPDTRLDTRSHYPEYQREHDLISYLGLPIRHEDRTLGVLVINTREVHHYTDEEIALYGAFAQQVAVALERARLFRERDQQRREAEVLAAIAEQLVASPDLAALLRRVTEGARELCASDIATIALWDESAQALRVRYRTGLDRDTAEKILIPSGRGIGGLVLATGAPFRTTDYVNDPRISPDFHADARADGITAVLAVPVRGAKGVAGVLYAQNQIARPFSAHDETVLQRLADQAAIAIENARLFAELSRSFQDLKQAQEAMVQGETLRALGQMASGIAHDLNNKLAVILGQAELLRLQVPSPSLAAGLDILAAAATQGAEVVRHILDFGRQRASTSLAPLALPLLVQGVLAITRAQWKDAAERRGAVITVRTDIDTLPPVLGHASEIREALTNLILNAVEAMPAGGALTVIGSMPEPGWVDLNVGDAGEGMPEEVRRRAFDPFFTTKGVQRRGLGLSVVYGIMERHGGSVAVRSAPGQGTTVTLRFRAAPDTAPPVSGAGQAAGTSRRLLVIDDEAQVRGTLAGLLGAAGHTVIEAESGAAGLAQMAAASVDLVLTDLGMPGMTGWDVARRVKAQFPALPVVLLTGWGEQAAGDGSTACVDRILGKPAPLGELLTVIAELTPKQDS